MKTAYLLPCKCGHNCEVDAGQAGTQITCTCGQRLTVPSIRGLRQLETVSTPDGQQQSPPWSPTRGAIFSLGLFVAAAGVFFSVYHGYWFYITTRYEDPAAIQLGTEHQHIDHLSLVDSVQLFRQEASEGLGDPNPPAWTAIDKKHESSRRWGIIGMIVAGAGLLASAGSMVGRSKRAG
ncbi:MAG TPA: hypothetical protein VMP01_04935 [Pirellulaceae bacterium]|nr:hypothetical protein [Pirellulaceae bacterium]